MGITKRFFVILGALVMHCHAAQEGMFFPSWFFDQPELYAAGAIRSHADMCVARVGFMHGVLESISGEVTKNRERLNSSKDLYEVGVSLGRRWAVSQLAHSNDSAILLSMGWEMLDVDRYSISYKPEGIEVLLGGKSCRLYVDRGVNNLITNKRMTKEKVIAFTSPTQDLKSMGDYTRYIYLTETE